MGWRHDWFWALPPDSDYETVEQTAEMLRLDRQFRQLRRHYRWQRVKSWWRSVGNIR